MNIRKFNLAYFVSHPIQYQAPMLRLLASHPEIELKVFFVNDISTRAYVDKGFGRTIAWDVPLLEDYDYAFLLKLRDSGVPGFLNPLVTGVGRALGERPWDAAWFHGYAHHALLYGIMLATIKRIPVFFRGESNLVCTSGSPVKDLFIRWLVNQAQALLWVSTANKEYYQHYGAQPKQLFFTPYAVDNKYFQEKVERAAEKVPRLKEELGISVDMPVILYASKWMARKNPLLLLDAFADMLQAGVRACLVYIGDGALRHTLEARVDQLNLHRHVKLLGFKNQTELPTYYALCDLFVLPSNQEPFGLVINEVMNAGKAVLTTDEVGAAKDLVHNGRNGFVIRAGDKEALKDALTAAVSDKNRLQQMGVESLQIINQWNYENDVDGILQALRETETNHAVKEG